MFRDCRCAAGRRPIAEIDAPGILTVLKRVDGRGARFTAHRVRSEISRIFRYAIKEGGEDVCSINANGVDNGYMMSTFSLPESVVAPFGHRALYTCPAGSTGGYAQCDGGICFTSSNGSSFPGFDKPLGSADIICACPITQTPGSPVGYQIAGPYPLDMAGPRQEQST